MMMGSEDSKDKDKKEKRKSGSIRAKSLDALSKSMAEMHLSEQNEKIRSPSDPKPSSERRRSLKSTSRLVPLTDSKIITLQEAFETDNPRALEEFHADSLKNPNGVVNFGQGEKPLILQAFLKEASQVFIYLLWKSANPEASDGQGDVGYYAKQNPEKWFPFLAMIQKELLQYLNFEALKKERMECETAGINFDQNWDIVYKNAPWSEGLSLAKLQSVIKSDEIVKIRDLKFLDQLIYELCTHAFSKAEISDIMVGIFFHYEALGEELPALILKILRVLYRNGSLSQRLSVLLIVKEMIQWDNCFYSFKQAYFSEFLKSLLEQAHIDKCDKLIQYLQLIHSLRIKLTTPLLTSFFYIENVLVSNGYLQTEKSFDRELSKALSSSPRKILEKLPFSRCSLKELAETIANDLRALSLQFYHKVGAWEFLHHTTKSKPIPTIRFMTETSTKITYFFVTEILKAKNQEEAKDRITLCIYTLKYLLGDSKSVMSLETGSRPSRSHSKMIPPIDLNSAMSILAALNYCAVDRLKATFDSLSLDAKEIWREVQGILSTDNGFGNHRVLMENNTTLSFLGLYLTDFTLSGDGNASPKDAPPKNRCLTFGKVLRGVFKHQSAARTLVLKPESDLLKNILQLALPEEETLWLRSGELELHVYNVSWLTDLEYFKVFRENVECYLRKGIPLQIKVSEEVLQGEKAMEALLHCFQGGMIAKKYSVEQVSPLFKLALQASRLPEACQRSFEQRLLAPLDNEQLIDPLTFLREIRGNQPSSRSSHQDEENKKEKRRSRKGSLFFS